MVLLILSIPFYSSIAISIFGRYLGQKGTILISISSILISLLLSFYLLLNYLSFNQELLFEINNWLDIGIFNISFKLYFDKYSIYIIFLITLISFIVISFSSWYMVDDSHKIRFFSLLLLFSVSMILLISSSNLFLLFVGWEGVGILSYLLINFWYFSINSNKSAIKAILYNKIGDIGLLIAISILLLINSNTDLSLISLPINFHSLLLNLLLTFFLFAAIAKSAQFFLHPWLGDAMAGPTPVSALLHAATMVTAGVYLLFRLDSLISFSPLFQNIIIFIGLITIIFGGISSINQNDIKKIIAYSTCSQLGYMFITNGFLSPSLGLFHLFTHGFFKALLFLSAGILIHNLNHEQDIRKFGSLLFSFPISFIFFFIASLSISSFPFLSGFFSKEPILLSSISPQFPIYIYSFLVIGTIFTSIYSFKLLYYTFFSKPNYISFNIYESFPISLLFILSILLFSSIFIGFFFNNFFLDSILSFSDFEFSPLFFKLIPVFFSLFGIFLAFISLNFWRFHYFLTIFNKRFFLDSLFNLLFSFNFLNFGYLYSFKFIDRGFLEYFGPIVLIRLLYSIPLYYSNHSIYISSPKDHFNLFIYLFLSFFFLIFLSNFNLF